MSLFDDYLNAIEQLLRQLTLQHPRCTDLLTLQGRLKDNIEDANRHGDTPELKAIRSKILSELNKLALETLNISFNDIVSNSRGILLNRAVMRNGIATQSNNFAQPLPTKHVTPVGESNENPITDLSHPAWQGVGAIATIVFGVITLIVTIVVALIQFKIIDINSLLQNLTR